MKTKPIHFIVSFLFASSALFRADARAGDFFEQCMKARTASEKIGTCSAAISTTRDPNRLERAHLRRGNAFIEDRRFDEAASDFSATIALNPNVAGYFDNRQFAHKAMGRFEDAMRDANHTVRLAPTRAFAYRSRAMVRSEMGAHSEAVADLSVAMGLEPRDAGLLVERGKVLSASGRSSDAIADFSRALEIDPRAADALRYRGMAYKSMGNFSAARQDLTAYAQIHPEDSEVARSLEQTYHVRPSGDVNTDGQARVPMEKEGGVYLVPVQFNGAITLGAIVDSGASDVSIPKDVALTLIRTRTVSETDFLGSQTYVMADGTKVPSPRLVLRSLKVGDRVLKNVEASIASEQAQILLGQSFLGRFKAWAIDNERHELLLK